MVNSCFLYSRRTWFLYAGSAQNCKDNQWGQISNSHAGTLRILQGNCKMGHSNKHSKAYSWNRQQGFLGAQGNHRMFPRKIRRPLASWRLHKILKFKPVVPQRFWSNQRLWKAHCIRCKKLRLPQNLGRWNYFKSRRRHSYNQLRKENRRSHNVLENGSQRTSASCKRPHQSLQENCKAWRACKKSKVRHSMDFKDNN